MLFGVLRRLVVEELLRFSCTKHSRSPRLGQRLLRIFASVAGCGRAHGQAPDRLAAGPSWPSRPSRDRDSIRRSARPSAVASARRDREKSLVSAERGSSPSGSTFEATEMMPLAAEPSTAEVMDVVAGEHVEVRDVMDHGCAIWPTMPDASFTPTMFSNSARRASVAGSTLTPVRPCTL